MNELRPLDYASVGVDYSNIDPYKLDGQSAARPTGAYIEADGLMECVWSRGESAYVIRLPNGDYLVVVIEGLGTKNKEAELVYQFTGESYYETIGQDNAAMSMNDLLTVGALPHAFMLKTDVGDDRWFTDEKRRQDFFLGCARSCEIARCSWGGGESAALVGIVSREVPVLSSVAVGYVASKADLINSEAIRPGDAIVFFRSSGICSNGLTLARAAIERMPRRYLTPLSDGTPIIEALLTPTTLYAPVMRELRRFGIHPSSAIAGTGHAICKVMRAKEPRTYVIDAVPEPHPIFAAIQEAGRIEDEKMHSTFNMGIGFTLIVRPGDAQAVIDVATALGVPAMIGGYVEPGPKRVVVRPRKLVYEATALQIR